jgi:hypothetical protein
VLLAHISDCASLGLGARGELDSVGSDTGFLLDEGKCGVLDGGPSTFGERVLCTGDTESL